MGGVAFYSACDRTTMSQDDIINGRFICQIGIAPVRPAEFVTFRIFQNTGKSQRQEQAAETILTAPRAR